MANLKAGRVIRSAVLAAALILCGAALPDLEVRRLPGTIRPALASHLRVPPLAGLKPVYREGDACRVGQDLHKIVFAAYDLPRGGWIRVYFRAGDRNPYALFDTRERAVYYDVERDGHFDGRAAIGEQPVGDNWCDLLSNILGGRVRPPKPVKA